ncbi:hypothetical protein E1295_23855 [Nonomuraea mesophila]|uniref:Uncharacterized protein n=1 Tax=Nonomuraea mesophila TaxID=2530382 RepID=A0A4V2Z9J8_9ACTN|nr:hypothetical protein [Nonomuraea mesophila]TDE45763.1 hypothetical protein E1295_23855 [Nonomuraea mesophila]
MSRNAPSSTPTAAAVNRKPGTPSTMLTRSSGGTRFADDTISNGNGADPGPAAGGKETSGGGTSPPIAWAPSFHGSPNPSGNGWDPTIPRDRVEPWACAVVRTWAAP